MKVYIIRWTDRPPHRYYKKMLAGGYQPLHILAHGNAPLDEYTEKYKSSFPENVVHTPHNVLLPKQIAYAWQKTLDNGERYFAVLDDDAIFTNGELLNDRATEAFSLDAGACGPIVPAMLFFRYYGKGPDASRMAPVKYPWFTSGMQIYDTEAMAPLWTSIIKPMLNRLKWRSDFQLFMAAHDLGLVPREFKCLGYNHASGGSSTGVNDEVYYRRRIDAIVHDYFTTVEYVKKFITPEFYLPAVAKSFRGECETLERSVSKTDLSTWSLPLLDDFKNIYTYAQEHGIWVD